LSVEFVPEGNKRFVLRLELKRRSAMKRASTTAMVTAIAILASPVDAFAQGAGGAARGC
jgi:hypothetical protein